MKDIGTLIVKHGSLVLNIPYHIFIPGTAEFSGTADEYFAMIQRRYPWLSDNSVAVLKKRTAEEMSKETEKSLRGPKKARMLSAEGRYEDALAHIESFLNEFPDYVDAWYALGEILCKTGRSDEGYKAMNRGRGLFSGKKDR